MSQVHLIQKVRAKNRSLSLCIPYFDFFSSSFSFMDKIREVVVLIAPIVQEKSCSEIPEYIYYACVFIVAPH